MWLVMGWLRLFEAGRKFDCINSPNTAHTIPVLVEDVKDFVSVSHYILVVEKESGKRLSRCSHKKSDAAGSVHLSASINYWTCYSSGFCNYLLTSSFFLSIAWLIVTRTALTSWLHKVPQIQWLGAFPSDSENFNLPQQCLLPLTIEEKSKTSESKTEYLAGLVRVSIKGTKTNLASHVTEMLPSPRRARLEIGTRVDTAKRNQIRDRSIVSSFAYLLG
ncbi:Detected protein of unknown function [Hibiscus syriacus]|uniref:Uncharacterized protein n=1 Tax=Hibiscus syriacus TaxID=106335 RepID=A0A6A3CA51_HIBSY|nr:Detected protein of unknown function [Hibiscus syriacus]